MTTTYVTLTDAQKATRDQAEARWVDTLKAQARDTTDPETQQNARLILRNRGITW